MLRRGIGIVIGCLAVPLISWAQVSDSARQEIIRGLFAEESAARIDMPLGGEGVQLSNAGRINEDKLQKQLQKNGTSIQTGRVVRLTAIEFSSKSIDIELDGGGTVKKSIGSHVQISVGASSTPQQPTSTAKAKGSKVTLQFAGKVPSDLTPDQLKQMLAPVLDFSKRTMTSTNIESLPPEFQEAVQAKEARIGMDEDTVLLAMGRPDKRTSEKVNGIEQEEWQYKGVGMRRTFVTFEKSVVVAITEH